MESPCSGRAEAKKQPFHSSTSASRPVVSLAWKRPILLPETLRDKRAAAESLGVHLVVAGKDGNWGTRLAVVSNGQHGPELARLGCVRTSRRDEFDATRMRRARSCRRAQPSETVGMTRRRRDARIRHVKRRTRMGLSGQCGPKPNGGYRNVEDQSRFPWRVARFLSALGASRVVTGCQRNGPVEAVYLEPTVGAGDKGGIGSRQADSRRGSGSRPGADSHSSRPADPTVGRGRKATNQPGFTVSGLRRVSHVAKSLRSIWVPRARR